MEIGEFCEKFLGVKLHPIQIEIVKGITKDTGIYMESKKYRDSASGVSIQIFIKQNKFLRV